MQLKNHKRTSVDIQGKEVQCYLLADTPSRQIIMITEDESWQYFTLYERFIEGDHVVFRRLLGPISSLEMEPGIFSRQHDKVKDRRKQHFRVK